MKWSPVRIFVLIVDTFTLLVELHKSGHILASDLEYFNLLAYHQIFCQN